MSDKPETLPEPDFRLKWRDGAYYVTKPNIGDTDCYTASTLRETVKGARLKALEEAENVCRKRFVGDHNREDFEARRCADAIRKLMEDEQ